jgi:hypothetical protein
LLGAIALSSSLLTFPRFALFSYRLWRDYFNGDPKLIGAPIQLNGQPFKLGPTGLMWHTRRLSWDGLDELRGLAWSPIDDKWCPFTVELNSGKSTGGSYFPNDAEGWETLTS